MNGLLTIFVSFSIFNTFTCQDHKSFLDGPNVCSHQEPYNVTRKVKEVIPTTLKSFIWCVKIPPQCTVYEKRNITIYVDKVVTEMRTVYECCEGYTISGRQCVPVCSMGCGKGTCVAPEKCLCEVGYIGEICDMECPQGKWGVNCRKRCNCKDGTCNLSTGECICPPGRIGEHCESECPEGTFGKGCLDECLCRNQAKCLPESGECVCGPGYTGMFCERPCEFGYYGENCALECVCLNGIDCDPVSGACICPIGFTGKYCEKQCESGWYGENCMNICNCYNNATCNIYDGSCGCLPGYIGKQCQDKCPAGSYGEYCLKSCDCNGAECDHITGQCICPKYFTGERCDMQFCPEGYYGSECNLSCYCEHNDSLTDDAPLNLGTYFQKHKKARVNEIESQREQAELLFQYIMDDDYKPLADMCARGINLNIADINNNYMTPLHLAAKQGSVSTLMTVLGCGVDINVLDARGNTPLHVAVMEKKFLISSTLLYKGADPYIYNMERKTPYQLAMDSKEAWIKFVFKSNRLNWYQKVRMLTKDEKNMFTNVQKGHYGSVGDACMKGVDVLILSEENNQNTALHIAAFYAQNVVPMILALLRCGGDINAVNADGNTPLHLAVIRGHSNATTTLLQFHANPFLKNNENQTAYELGFNSTDPTVQTIFNEPLLSWYLNTHFIN